MNGARAVIPAEQALHLTGLASRFPVVYWLSSRPGR
jgi:hypothetical protein